MVGRVGVHDDMDARAEAVFGQLRDRVPELARRMIARAREVIPEVADLDPEQQSRMERSLREVLDQICNHLTGADMRVDHLFLAGWQRAEAGFPFAAIVSVVLETTRMFREAAAALIPDDDRVLREMLSDRMFSAVNVGTRTLLEGYQQAAVERAQRDTQRLSTLIEALLAGRGRDPDVQGTVAESLGLPLRGRFCVAVARQDKPFEAVGVGIQRRPNDSARTVRRLTADEQVAIVSLADSDCRLVQQFCNDHPDARIGLSIEYADISETAEALRQARRALASLAGTTRRAGVYGDDPLAIVLLAAPREATELITRRLGAVRALAVQDRDMLLETIRAWFDAAGSTPQAANRLHCHRNTVRYRLQRVQELTGVSFDDPVSTAELRVALRACELFPDRPETR